jgi:hypothetical protein
LVPDALWVLVEPLMPSFVARPQGGGRAPVADRAVFTAVVYSVEGFGQPADEYATAYRARRNAARRLAQQLNRNRRRLRDQGRRRVDRPVQQRLV